jgi:predicted SAM-dependent methyltransferase
VRRSRLAADRLHVGCGQSPIPGWVNIDSRPLAGVDRVLDIRKGLPYSGVSFIFAEHFLEHLCLEEGLAFLRDCRRALSPDGVLRLSTPNLDWVMLTHYRVPRPDPEEAFVDSLRMNRAFRGWGHRFLYNSAALTMSLRAAGFSEVSFHAYGESPTEALRGLERHEMSEDTPDLPHVLIAEALGESAPVPLPERYVREFLRDMAAG